MLYQLNIYILNRPYVVIYWNGGLGPHHENQFDAVLSVTGHNTGTHSCCDFVAWMEFDWIVMHHK